MKKPIYAILNTRAAQSGMALKLGINNWSCNRVQVFFRERSNCNSPLFEAKYRTVCNSL